MPETDADIRTPPAADAPPSNRVKLDAQGRMIPRTPDERAADAERLREWVRSRKDDPAADPPGSDEEFWRAIDSHRPDRPLFEGLY